MGERLKAATRRWRQRRQFLRTERLQRIATAREKLAGLSEIHR